VPSGPSLEFTPPPHYVNLKKKAWKNLYKMLLVKLHKETEVYERV
jgi:hypothetical protein